MVREGRVEGMNKSYKFESRDIVLQEVESNSPKVPFTIEQPAADFQRARVAAVRRQAHPGIARHAHHDVAVDRRGLGRSDRAIACWPRARRASCGRSTASPRTFPRVMHLRVYGMNANGKVYAIDRAFQLNP